MRQPDIPAEENGPVPSPLPAERRVQRIQVGISYDLVHPCG